MSKKTHAGQPLRKRDSFTRQYEKAAFYILLAWCLLPAVMCLDYVISGLLGRYPTREELLSEGIAQGTVNYTEALLSYQFFFFVLGGISVCFALLCILQFGRRVFSRQSVRRMPWFYLFAAFLLWAAISALHARNRDALFGNIYMRDGLVSYLIYGSVFLCASLLRREDYRKKLLRTFAAVISLLALIMLIQESTKSAFLNYVFSSRRAMVFNQFNHFGYMLCLAAVTLLGLFLYDTEARKWLRWLYPLLALFLCYAIVINNTFGALLAVIAALPVMLVFYLRSGRRIKRRAAAIILLLVLAAGLCFFLLSPGRNRLLRNFTQLKTDLVKILTRAEDAGTAGTNRFGLWKETVARIRQHPVLGLGPEGLGEDNALTDNLLPHNTYLQIAAYTGIVGLLLYLSALLSLAGDRWRHIRRLDPMVLTAAGAAFAYLVSAFVGCPVFNTEPYFWLFLGITAAARPGLPPLLCPDGEGEEEEEEPAPAALERLAHGFPRRCERMALVLLLAWCLLPAVMSVLFPVMGALGIFPSPDELLSAGMPRDGINYSAALSCYQTLFFILGAVTLLFALLCLAFCRRELFSRASVRQRPWLCLLAGLLGWAALSSFLSDYYYLAFRGGSYFSDGLASFFVYGSVFLCALLIRREDYRRRILRVFAAVICYLSLIMLVQERADSAYLNYIFPSSRAVVFNQFNHFGYLLCMAIACTVGLFFHDRGGKAWLRWEYLAAALYLAYALTVNDTFGAMLAALLSLPVILLLYVRSGGSLNRRAAGIALALAVLGAVCFFTLTPGGKGLMRNFTQMQDDLVKIATNAEDAGNAGSGRFELWRETLQRIGERPVFGFGPEGFVGKSALTENKRPHNEYLAMTGYLGIPALLLYLGALITLAVHQWRRLRRLPPMVLVAAGMTAAYLISAFVGNSVFNTAPYFWLALGLTAGVCEGEEPLLCPQDGTADEEKRTRRFFLLGVALCVLLCIPAGLSLKNERSRELEDLETMQAAETAIRKSVDPAALGSVSYYWYDKQKAYFYPAMMAPPAPYGLGTENSGGASAVFFKEHGYMYSYDEAADYSGKVVLAAVAADPDGGLRLVVNWYAPEG